MKRKEKNIKALVLNHIFSKHWLDKDPLVINELSLDGSERRVDLAIISKDKLIAFEIKSEVDSLERLEGQVEKYLKYFDKVIIVAASKHVDAVREMTQPNIEVWGFSNGKIKIIRRGSFRKICNKLNYLDLLIKEDLLRLSKLISLNCKGMTKFSLRNLLNTEGKRISFFEMKNFIIQVMTARYSLTSNLFCKVMREKGAIEEGDIKLLSPYLLNTKKRVAVHNVFETRKEGQPDDPLMETLSNISKEPIFGTVPGWIITDH